MSRSLGLQRRYHEQQYPYRQPEEVAEVYRDLVARSADGQIETMKYQVLDSMLLNELRKQNSTIAAAGKSRSGADRNRYHRFIPLS